jgi:hypothetical protein
MGLKGDLSSIKGLKQRMRAMPVTIAADVATRSAPALTTFTTSDFSSGRTVYGETRPAGVNGNALSLVKSGATRDSLRFVAIGTIIRCVLPTRWARYLVGRYQILPNGPLPVGWSRKLAQIVSETEPK